MNDQALRFRFGVFVLASLILLAVLIVLFGGFPNYFKRTTNYTVQFASAQGIAPGTPIRRSGVRIGEVRGLKLNLDTGKVDIFIRIDENYYLRKGDRPTLQQSLIGGDATIAFIPPDDAAKDDPTPVEPDSVIVGLTPLDPSSLVQKTSDLVQPVHDALIEVRKVFQRIDKLGPVIEETLKDFRQVGKFAHDVGPELRRTNDEIQITARNFGRVGERVDVLLRTNEDKIVKSLERMDESLRRINELFGDDNQKSIRDILRNVKTASGQLDVIAKEAGELVKDSRVTVKQVTESLKRADGALADLQKVLKPVGERGPTILKNVEESSESLNATLKDVRELIHAVGRNEGTFQKLLLDPSLYNNLNDSAYMVTRILPRLDQVLRDVEVFADKLARHPELIGIGGVIRPSSGLKESPTSPQAFRIFPMNSRSPTSNFRAYP
ncbi:MAG: MCE family protein [Gemmataceae bacterium]|nr:MCE family protein [Gemmataceae bacterium]